MKFLYLLFLQMQILLLIQVATCQESDSTSYPETEPSVSTMNVTSDYSEFDQSDTTSFDNSSSTADVFNGTDTTTSIPSTTGGDVTETVPYTQATDDATTTTTKQEPSTPEPKPVHALATLVHPSVLAIIAPVCIRLFSTKLSVVV